MPKQSKVIKKKKYPSSYHDYLFRFNDDNIKQFYGFDCVFKSDLDLGVWGHVQIYPAATRAIALMDTGINKYTSFTYIQFTF